MQPAYADPPGGILVTGFEPFGSHRFNPSEHIARELPRRCLPPVVAEILPTSYARAGTLVEQLLTRGQPSAVILLGLAANASGLRLERHCHNWDASDSPDNDGVRRSGAAIAELGQARYGSTLPLDRFAAALQRLGCPYEFSDSAGRFVCNHVFYRARRWLERNQRSTTPCGFLHVPATPQGQLQPWLGAVAACVELLASELVSPSGVFPEPHG